MASRYWAAVAGLAADRDVLPQVAGGEGCEGGALRLRFLALRRIVAGADAGDDEGRAPACLVRADDAVAADGDAPRAGRAPRLHDVDPGAGGIDADAEAGERAVPDHRVALCRQPFHRAVRDRAQGGRACGCDVHLRSLVCSSARCRRRCWRRPWRRRRARSRARGGRSGRCSGCRRGPAACRSSRGSRRRRGRGSRKSAAGRGCARRRGRRGRGACTTPA